MNNTFYAPNDYRNYLAHFGVKGMKWGVRKNRGRSAKGDFYRFSSAGWDLHSKIYSKLGAKKMAGVSKSVSRYASKKADEAYAAVAKRRAVATYNREQRKRIASRQNDERYAEYNRQIQNTTDPAERMSIHVGARNKEVMNRADARTYGQLAKYSTFKPQRAYYEAKAFNADQRAKYYRKQHKKAGEDKIYEMLTPIDKYRTPYQTITGKRITYGQHKLQAAAAKGLGLAGLATYAVNRNRKKHK